MAVSFFLITGLAEAVCVNGNPSIEQEYSNSQSAFIGKVIKKKHIPESNDYYDGDEYTVQVQESFKGQPKNPIVIFSENSSGRFPMVLGSIYILFVYDELGRHHISNCGNSGLLGEKGNVVLAVRSLKQITETKLLHDASPPSVASQSQNSNPLPLVFTIIALSISTLAFVVATMNYRRKSGVSIRGAFSIASSISCDDQYVSGITLENLKDRAITIFGIYLRIGYNYYIQLEDLANAPLVLKAFEPYQKKYGPIEFYSVSSRRIKLDKLLNDNSVRKQLILSTADGKYVVPSNIRRWSPIGDFFRNHMTAVIRPILSKYKDTYLGSNVKYVVEFIGENDKEEIIPIHSTDYELKIFKNFSLTKESLSSKEAFENLLKQQIIDGKLSCKKFTVHDIDTWRQRGTDFFSDKTIEAKHYNIFQYYIMGKVLTKYSDWSLKRKNAQRNRKQ